MFVKAIAKYQLALSSAPKDKNTLINCATTYFQLLETQARMKKASVKRVGRWLHHLVLTVLLALFSSPTSRALV
jgi:hypothetical protein